MQHTVLVLGNNQDVFDLTNPIASTLKKIYCSHFLLHLQVVVNTSTHSTSGSTGTLVPGSEQLYFDTVGTLTL